MNYYENSLCYFRLFILAGIFIHTVFFFGFVVAIAANNVDVLVVVVAPFCLHQCVTHTNTQMEVANET